MIKLILNWLDLISTEKKGKQQWSIKMLSLSQLLTVCYRERVKHICLKISLKFLEICSKHVFVWV